MKIYLAGRFHKRHELHDLGKTLEKFGHEIVSRWTLPDSDHVKPAGLSKRAADNERRRFAVEDYNDVVNCDCMVSLMDEPRGNGRGGRHVEFGIALGLAKTLVIIGCRETVFHHLPWVEHHETISDYKKFLAWQKTYADYMVKNWGCALVIAKNLAKESYIDCSENDPEEMAIRYIREDERYYL